jgi:5'-methylthioadenosine phosphorylase
MAHVTDYDVWHVSELPVTVEMVIQTLNKNTLVAQEAIRNLARNLTEKRTCDCDQTLASALITRPEIIPPATREKVDLLVKKYF